MDVKTVSGLRSFEINPLKERETRQASTDSVREKSNQPFNGTKNGNKDVVLGSIANQEEISKEDLENTVEGLNEFLEKNLTSLKFQIHEDLNRVFVEVIDRKTQEVVKEIPSKQFLDMISSMLRHVGLIVDKKI